MWREPGEGDPAAGPLRCFVRNLRTGEEEYLPRLDDVASSLARSLAAGSGSSGVSEQGVARAHPTPAIGELTLS